MFKILVWVESEEGGLTLRTRNKADVPHAHHRHFMTNCVPISDTAWCLFNHCLFSFHPSPPALLRMDHLASCSGMKHQSRLDWRRCSNVEIDQTRYRILTKIGTHRSALDT